MGRRCCTPGAGLVFLARRSIMKSLSCRDVGMDCDHVMTGENEDELMRKAGEHGREKHSLREISAEMKQKIGSMIKSVWGEGGARSPPRLARPPLQGERRWLAPL